MGVRIDLQNVSGTDEVPDAARFAAWVEAALLSPGETLEQTLRIVDEDESRALNHRYRGKDRPTNVLAFPADDRYLDYRCLGDLLLCAPVVLREAAEQGKAADAHWAHLVVHGMLHLQGYDHAEPAERAEMEGLEIKILGELGYINPYND